MGREDYLKDDQQPLGSDVEDEIPSSTVEHKLRVQYKVEGKSRSDQLTPTTTYTYTDRIPSFLDDSTYPSHPSEEQESSIEDVPQPKKMTSQQEKPSAQHSTSQGVEWKSKIHLSKE